MTLSPPGSLASCYPLRASRVLGASFAALLLLVSAASGRANTRLVIADGVSVLMPPGFHHAVTRLNEGDGGDEGVTLFEVRDGADALVLVIYRGGRTRAAPSAEQALEIHTEELASRLDKAQRSRTEVAGLRLLGERRPTRYLRAGAPHEHLAWVVAAEVPSPPASKGRAGGAELTVVCSALYLPGSPNAAAFAKMVEGVAVAGRKAAP